MILYDELRHTFIPTEITDDHVDAGFSDRNIGDGRKIATVISYLQNNNVPFKTVVSPKQIHSTNIETVRSDYANQHFVTVEDTDGLITRESGVVLSVITADCVPIIFADKKNGVIGISHQGWRGTLKQMVVQMVQKMQEIGAECSQLRVAIGPAIGQCCYDIDEERYADFMDAFSEKFSNFVAFRKGKPHLNLLSLNYQLLHSAGIPLQHIDFFPFCTSCDSHRFHSFRRDNKNNYGEMVSYITYD